MVIVPRSGAEGARSTSRTSRPLIVIADGQPLFVEALARLLALPPLNAVTRTASSTEDASLILSAAPADLVLCGVGVQQRPLDSFLRLRTEAPGAPPLILLAETDDEETLLEVIDTDVAGFFTKDVEPEEFLEGIRAVLSGHRAIGANVMRRLIARMNGTDGPVRPTLAQLSPTEVDILAMVGAGRTVDQIAQARGISRKTVRNHLASIYRKLELRSRTEAMLCAVRMGLVAS